MLKYTIEEFAELLGTKPAKPNSPIYHEPPIVILGIKKSDPVQTKQLVLFTYTQFCNLTYLK